MSAVRRPWCGASRADTRRCGPGSGSRTGELRHSHVVESRYTPPALRLASSGAAPKLYLVAHRTGIRPGVRGHETLRA